VVLDARQNSKFSWGFGRGATRGALLLHEIGHALGLMHVGVTSQTMYPSVVSRASTGFNTGDLAGLRKLGRSAGCLSSPSWVWTDLK
jgi:predicted Zn-dependent protease